MNQNNNAGYINGRLLGSLPKNDGSNPSSAPIK